jgi:transcriptional regulator with XRE-family HTH domain
MSEIGTRIKKLRRDLGLKQVQFCQQARISQGYLAELEGGKKNPSPRVLLAIAEAFGVNESWLLTGRGKRERTDEILLSTEERAVVTLYRRLKPKAQVATLLSMKSLVK